MRNKMISWKPKALKTPSIAKSAVDAPTVGRTAEVFRYSILSIEYWVSPDGLVREWVRHNTRLAIVLAVPAFFVVPIVTFLLWQLVSWAEALTSLAGKLIILPVLALIAFVVVMTVLKLVGAVLSKK